MIIQINDYYRLHDLQLEFTRKFPFLKIEFLKTTSRDWTLSKFHLVEAERPCVCDVRNSHEEGELEINSDMTVEQFESSLVRKFSLPIKVFRKMGKIWRDTKLTCSWTLYRQNEHGKMKDDPLELFW
jgi:hypothetical protein